MGTEGPPELRVVWTLPEPPMRRPAVGRATARREWRYAPHPLDCDDESIP
jgi:hypothetical protein